MTEQERDKLAGVMGWHLAPVRVNAGAMSAEKHLCWVDKDGKPIRDSKITWVTGGIMLKEYFHPDTDMNQAVMVAEKVAQRLHDSWHLWRDVGGRHTAHFGQYEAARSAFGPADALSHACLQAVEATNGN